MKYLARLETAQLAQHLEQTQVLWGKSFTADERGRLLRLRLEDADNKLFLSGLVDADGKLVCSLKRYHFELALGKRLARCVGLGAIFTNPEFRKQGFAGELIRTVMKEAHEQFHCDFAVLYSDIGREYYEGFGFRSTPALSWKISAGKLSAAQPLTLRLATDADCSALLRWYQSYTARFKVKTARTEKTWRFYRQLNGIERDFIVSKDGTELGFLTVSLKVEKSSLRVEEWLVPPEHEDAIWAAVRELARQSNCTEVSGWLLPVQRKLAAAQVLPRAEALPMIADLTGAEAVGEAMLAESYFASPDHF